MVEEKVVGYSKQEKTSSKDGCLWLPGQLAKFGLIVLTRELVLLGQSCGCSPEPRAGRAQIDPIQPGCLWQDSAGWTCCHAGEAKLSWLEGVLPSCRAEL